MYRWCSYCQGFLGETEPRNDYQISHGICPPCKVRLSSENDNLVSRAKLTKEFFASIRKDLVARTNRDSSTLLRQAQDLGIAPFDILAGLIQPLLYEIAELQNAGEATVCQEHDFSMLVDGVFSEIRKASTSSATHLTTGAPKVLIACADGNYHVFGPRLIKEYLLKEGISAKCLFPSLPFDEIISAGLEVSAKIIGISVATAEQAEMVVKKWHGYIKTSRGKNSPTLILGGQGASSVKILPTNTHVHNGNLIELKTLIEGKRFMGKLGALS
jgi:methanogenic corrinoid protein MtbC1